MSEEGEKREEASKKVSKGGEKGEGAGVMCQGRGRERRR